MNQLCTPSPPAKKSRGRPSAAGGGNVVNNILDATERLLQNESHYDLTIRRISAEAGVNNRMVKYYFNDKDGLIFSVIARYCDEVSTKLKTLDAIDPSSSSPTRQIFKIVMSAYYAKPWIARIIASELSRNNSLIKTAYLKRYGREAVARLPIRRVFVRLIESGVYNSKMDIDKAVLSVFYTCAAPAMLAPLASDIDSNRDRREDDEWISYIAEMFDRGALKRA